MLLVEASGAGDGIVPAFQTIIAGFFRDLRTEAAINSPVGSDIIQIMPVADGETRKVGSAHSGSLYTLGAKYLATIDVCLGLQEIAIGSSASVHFQCTQGNAGIGLHGTQNIRDLVGQRIQGWRE